MNKKQLKIKYNTKDLNRLGSIVEELAKIKDINVLLQLKKLVIAKIHDSSKGGA